MGKKRFITARDVDELLEQGQSEMRVDCDTVVTDVGRERARERGLRLVLDGESSPSPPNVPSGASGNQAAASNKAELAEIVTRVVVTHLGSKPANLEAVISKVLDRHQV
ncbi:MAG: hypothetical protein EA428_05340 [Spirochaetaceae bacterium]|nr:MAG: hypothetical protein EA428_05340 [Spirochaetaceae bacterium]